jgi:hypothetical protein
MTPIKLNDRETLNPLPENVRKNGLLWPIPLRSPCGVHAVCLGEVSAVPIGPEHAALVCPTCNLRIVVPVSALVSWTRLREYLIAPNVY